MINTTGIKHQIPNMMRMFKRRLVSQQELDAMLVGISSQQRNLGSLPSDWFSSSLPKDKYSTFTQKIFSVFGNFAKKSKSQIDTKESYFVEQLEELEKRLEKALGKKIKTQHIGRGSIGRTFKLVVGENEGKKYVIKIFHLGERVDGHGKSKEIANAINYSHTKQKPARAQFFFGRIAGKKNYDGFMVTEYIPGKEDVFFSVPGPQIKYSRFNLIDAIGRNKKQGSLVDFGEIERKYTNKKAEEIAKQLIDALKKSDYKHAKKIVSKYKKLPEYEEVVLKLLDDCPIDEDICRMKNIRVDWDYTPEQIKIIKMLEEIGCSG